MGRKSWLILSACLAAVLLSGLQLLMSKSAAGASGTVSAPALSQIAGVVRNAPARWPGPRSE